jgi:hypothetical protein
VRQRSIGNLKRSLFVSFECNLLSKQNVACWQIAFGPEAPSYNRPASIIELAYVGLPYIQNTVAFAGVGARGLKVPNRAILEELSWRQPFLEQNDRTPLGLRALAK